MARSYKSALPTWSTFTPHVSPLGVQPAVNQENYWHKRAPGWQHPGNIAGELNRIYGGISQSVKGTGAGYAAVTGMQHTPILNALQQASDRRRSNRQWAESMQEALQRQAPEDIVAEGEEHPQSEMQVRAARTAAPSVNPADVVKADAARSVAGTLVPKVLADPKAGGSTLKITDKRASKGLL